MNIVICNSQNWFHLNDDLMLKHKILIIQDKESLCVDTLKSFEPDIVFFPHWSWIVEREIFTQFKCIVFHTSPLPYGRGGSPIQNLILRGHKVSPVCALKMSNELDNGPIYDQEEISLEGSLCKILNRLDSTVNMLMKRLIDHLPTPIEQTGVGKTFKRLGDKDNEISFDTTFEKAYDIVRMLDDPSYPSAYLSLKNILIEFSEVNRKNDEFFCRVRISKKGTI